MQKNPSPLIQHIIEATEKIFEYTEGVSKVEFRKNTLIQDAVIRQLEIIGEASNKLEVGFKSSHPKIPWKEIVGMRNKLAHEYWDVDIELLWHASQVEVPELKSALLTLFSQLGK